MQIQFYHGTTTPVILRQIWSFLWLFLLSLKKNTSSDRQYTHLRIMTRKWVLWLAKLKSIFHSDRYRRIDDLPSNSRSHSIHSRRDFLLILLINNSSPCRRTTNWIKYSINEKQRIKGLKGNNQQFIYGQFWDVQNILVIWQYTKRMSEKGRILHFIAILFPWFIQYYYSIITHIITIYYYFLLDRRTVLLYLSLHYVHWMKMNECLYIRFAKVLVRFAWKAYVEK